MLNIHLRPLDPHKDFGEIAALISCQEDEPTCAARLREDYEAHQESRLRIMVAADEQGQLLGFYWAWRNQVEPSLAAFLLVVKPEQRRQGTGNLLYEDMTHAFEAVQPKKVRVSLRDDCPQGRTFAEQRGFALLRQHFGMELDLRSFDEHPYAAILERLEGEGICFTSMAELGDTPENQRRLYALNDAASASTPGQAGEHAWVSFEDFQKSVCQAEWYQPAGQIVAIDTLSGEWAAMSAITQMLGREYAYNLFTGVDLAYRGRKLGQAVKVLALRYARQVLKAAVVRTHHNTHNLPMIAIDRKFGYRQLPGTILMEKTIG